MGELGSNSRQYPPGHLDPCDIGAHICQLPADRRTCGAHRREWSAPLNTGSCSCAGARVALRLAAHPAPGSLRRRSGRAARPHLVPRPGPPHHAQQPPQVRCGRSCGQERVMRDVDLQCLWPLLESGSASALRTLPMGIRRSTKSAAWRCCWRPPQCLGTADFQSSIMLGRSRFFGVVHHPHTHLVLSASCPAHHRNLHASSTLSSAFRGRSISCR